MNEADLARRLIAIVEAERRASRESLKDVHDLLLEERVAQGDAIRGLRRVSRDGGVLHLALDENISRFREGDPVWLSTGDPRADHAVAAAIRDFDPVERRLTVELEPRRAEPKFLDGEIVLDRRELDFVAREIEAIRAVFSHRKEFESARNLLLGRAIRKKCLSVATSEDASREGLDASQAAAFVAATECDFELVQGPPGAGKTRLAAAVIEAFLRAGKRVCVTAFTHKAVNNVLVRLALSENLPTGTTLWKIERGAPRELAGLGAVKLVPSARIAASTIPLCGPLVVGVTTHSAAALLERRFDVVLVDEAGQVSLPHGACALALSDRHVLVGDHHQLPPLIVGDHRDPLAEISLFEHLHRSYGSRMLETTYRMNDALCAFPSAAFYGGRVVASRESRTRRLSAGASADPFFLPEPEALVVPLSHRGARVIAPCEAAIAAELAVRAIRAGVDPREVAVIAPHRAQGNRIRQLLRASLPDLPADQRPLVDTVERLQGGERDVIILSLTASDPEAMFRDADFFFSPNRLNVSLTRARKKLIVLMSDALLDAWPDSATALYGAELLRRIWRDWPHERFEDDRIREPT